MLIDNQFEHDSRREILPDDLSALAVTVVHRAFKLASKMIEIVILIVGNAGAGAAQFEFFLPDGAGNPVGDLFVGQATDDEIVGAV